MVPPYGAREARFAALARSQALLSRRYSRARLTVAAATALVAMAWLSDPSRPWAVPALLAGIAAFVVLIVRHDRIEDARDTMEALAALNHEAQHRFDRAWSKLPPAWHVEGLDDHAYAADLDLFGHASLADILGPVRTPAGRVIVSRWLLHGPQTADPETIARRQDAVRELASQLDLRQQLTVAARRIPALDSVPAQPIPAAAGSTPGGSPAGRGLGPGSTPPPDPKVRPTGVQAFTTGETLTPDREATHASVLGGAPPVVRFVEWAEGSSWLFSRPWIPVTSMGLGLGTTGLFIAWLTGFIASPWWLALSLAGWVVRYFVRHPIEQAFAGAAGEHGLRSWTALIGLIDQTSWTSPELRAVRSTLSSGGRAAIALGRLEQLVALADFRLSTWLYLPVQSLTLWELHVWWAIERWRAAHGHHVADWLEAVGKVEALSSLASLAHDHPDWAFPDVSASHARLDATGLGHPLLANGVRVPNDVQLGPPGRFLLITGSNMSGKSTLLRSIGVNIVLAHAGGPACAARMSLPPLTLHTSMRVADSLERGLSLFMASLVRLERIVRAAREARDRRMCYLLDEVLQGTNSAERQIAVRTIIGHLLHTSAIGAATTHDLELARDPAFSAHADSFHLQETLVRDGDNVTMTFDYTLRPGPAQAGNALELLRLLGLR